jgi:hypothetical protein
MAFSIGRMSATPVDPVYLHASVYVRTRHTPVHPCHVHQSKHGMPTHVRPPPSPTQKSVCQNIPFKEILTKTRGPTFKLNEAEPTDCMKQSVHSAKVYPTCYSSHRGPSSSQERTFGARVGADFDLSFYNIVIVVNFNFERPRLMVFGVDFTVYFGY